MSLAVASRYANALADVILRSKEAVSPQAVVDQLRSIEEAIEHSADLRSVLLSPAIPMQKKNAVMGKICDRVGVHRLVQNFIFVVVRNRRGNLFPQIRAAFERVLDERTGVIQAEVQSVSELDPESRARMEVQLGRLTGRRVRANYLVNTSLLGGASARIGSTVYDGSLRGQLETLRRKLSNGA